MPKANKPFSALRSEVVERTGLRTEIDAAYRRPEAECVVPLLPLATFSSDDARRVETIARDLIGALRERPHWSPAQALMHEYALSTHEGVALMCLAEALLRIPDASTKDALIRDKIAAGAWSAHAGHSGSLFVNAASWGLMVTGKLVAPPTGDSLSAALVRLVARGGEPILRQAIDGAMRLISQRFVAGRTIDEALANARRLEAKGFFYSYDMLGEAATTSADADRYFADYERAIHAIGATGRGGVQDGPGVSIKLSALHPRHCRAQRERVMRELLPRVSKLVALARRYDIGLSIDAEEADRFDLSLDILDQLSLDPTLGGWDGLGFVVQAYGKRCTFVIDWLIDLARRSRRRLMVRLVKGAYWDAEIKRAQVDGLDGFPVLTRKAHTDVSYLACARKLLAAPDAVYPQFGTHNAQTLASILVMAGPQFERGAYEFQCLHGMGEPLYEELALSAAAGRPCRIYAPVGSHETLLAYLARRLLENGANSSFVHRIADPTVAIAELVADPAAQARAVVPLGAPSEGIAASRNLYGRERRNSRGLDLTDERSIKALSDALAAGVDAPLSARAAAPDDIPVLNPADRRDRVGSTRHASPAEIETALARADAAAPAAAATPLDSRAAVLRRAANAIEAHRNALVGLIVREAGRTIVDTAAEVREAVDFLRYYANEAERLWTEEACVPLGLVICISPWNFPLSIFVGQIAGALAAGNAVLAKPAEETPLIAAEAVRLLHAAGVPSDVLQLVPGAGEVGAALVADARTQGVVFTGSTAVGRAIQKQLASRLTRRGGPVPLIAETGGINAMIADSSALAEQVVSDAVASAFNSAGQRCSALRILCLQEEIAGRAIRMLIGAMRELSTGPTDRLSSDVGPIISAEARDAIVNYVAGMRARGFRIHQAALGDETQFGTFVAPTIVEISTIADVEREVFGPVLHVLRYRREAVEQLIDAINAAGYGLTFGVHSRIDAFVARVSERIEAGNVYVNRTIIGATVGVQPFGGSRLSGTGPKAGGPLYLGRLVHSPPAAALARLSVDLDAIAPARLYGAWLRAQGHDEAASRCERYAAASRLGASIELAGPVGERNVYSLRPRGDVAAVAATRNALLAQIGAILATGNRAVVRSDILTREFVGAPSEIVERVVAAADVFDVAGLACVLFEGNDTALRQAARTLADRPGHIVALQAMTIEAFASGRDYDLDYLLEERASAINTAAAGGNPGLMSMT
jgi:RHH-type transcriptional regulator, proline utilization regulon repressor / proline dehydrogenase / delta 1-pyrroline-5-carboxylate dehydrogenase